MSALPKAVQEQLDRAEELQRQLANPAPEQGTPEAEPTPEPEVAQPQEPVQQQTQATPSVPEETWEQRFRIMEGKFKAEVPRLHEQNRELSERLEQAVKALEDATKPKPQETKLVTDADVESFGSDLVDMVRRAAREEFDVLSKQFAGELDKRFGMVAQKVEQTEKVVAKTAQDKFWDSVYKDHKDFDAVNNDPRWFEFLDTKVPGARFTRRSLAEDAISKLDAESLNEQLKLFKEAITPQQPAEPPKPKPNLNSMTPPNTSSASAPPAGSPQGRIWSGAEYAAALDHRNLQRMSRADYDAQVAAAESALAEGRVRF